MSEEPEPRKPPEPVRGDPALAVPRKITKTRLHVWLDAVGRAAEKVKEQGQ